MRKILCLGLISLVLAVPSLGYRPASGAPSARIAADSGRKGIDDFNRRFIAACRSMDHKAAADLWDDEGVDLLPGMEPMIGKAAISQWLNSLDEQMRGAKVTQCDVHWEQTAVAGGMAYEWGINTQVISVPDKPEPLRNKGKITLILRRQADGNWKLALESWNSSPQN